MRKNGFSCLRIYWFRLFEFSMNGNTMLVQVNLSHRKEQQNLTVYSLEFIHHHFK